MASKMSLLSLGKLLKVDIAYDDAGAFSYVEVNAEFIVKHNPLSKKLELLNRKTRVVHALTSDDISDMLTRRSTFHIQKKDSS